MSVAERPVVAPIVTTAVASTTTLPWATAGASVAIVHDNLAEQGGAERVALSIARAFPGARVHTAVFRPATTYPAFADIEVAPLWVSRMGLIRRHHRAAFPVLAPSFSRLSVRAAVTVCSSSGWAHGVRTEGRKVVYCHNPARWLYQRQQYLGDRPGWGRRVALGLLHAPLVRWDQRAALDADRYLVNSTVVRDRVWRTYGIDAEVLPPPVSLVPGAPEEPVATLDPGFWVCVSRLLPYKNVAQVVAAFAAMPGERLVVVGTGAEEAAIRACAPANVAFTGGVTESQLRWLYASCQGLVAASYEDFGLTPVEAAAFGKPVAALRWGGFLDTVVEGETGVFFDRPEPDAIAAAVTAVRSAGLSSAAIRAHADRYSTARFTARLRAVVDEELARA